MILKHSRTLFFFFITFRNHTPQQFASTSTSSMTSSNSVEVVELEGGVGAQSTMTNMVEQVGAHTNFVLHEEQSIASVHNEPLV